MRKILMTYWILILAVSMSFGQSINIPITLDDGAGSSQILNFGLDLSATDTLDSGLGEADLPPAPPAGTFDARFVLPANGFNGTFSSWKDYRPATGPNFTGSREHRLKYQPGTGTVINISYNLPSYVSVILQDILTGSIINQTLTGTGSYQVTNPSGFTALKFTANYTNAPLGNPGPTFGISPAAPLTFTPTAIGTPNTLPVTISNSGTTNALSITNITSSDGQFTFSPNTFPINVPAGGNTIVNVTFTPTASGSQTGSLTFTHNASGSPTSYAVQGIGASAGPIFSLSTASLNFGNTSVGSPVTRQVTVSNAGLTNPLNISAVVAAPLQYSVAPTTANIAAGGNQIFTVTFTPTAGGTVPGTLIFTHNDPGSPDTVSLTGAGLASFGLVFAEDTLRRKEDSTYTDVIQLKALSATAQAIQFRLLVNKAAGDSPTLTFLNLQKGSDVSAASWSLQYEVFRGPLQANGSSVDSIYVLLYNLNQNAGLASGDYNNLLTLTYRVADLPALVDSQKSSFRIAHAEASTFQGNPINITPSNPGVQLTIWALNRASSRGDVNGDGSIDILDLINVVDHILGRDSLSSAEFVRADIAPWTPGAANPTPDGLVNVQDLSLIQNIILTGHYPDGTALNKALALAKVGLWKSSSADIKVLLNIAKDGISVSFDSKVAIRGAQLEFDNVGYINNMVIDTKLGGGFYAKVNTMLRVLLYDQKGEAVVEAGKNHVATMPFSISDPKSISLKKIILVNTENQKVQEIDVEISYVDNVMPTSYSLSQNFPNPFNPTTNIKFSVPETNQVKITIFNSIGQEVRTLFLGQVDQGAYEIQWDGKDNSGRLTSSGMYIYKMTAGTFSQSRKMMFLK
ncbi:MAG TPA: choice-of-anchor D domain-containing protein [Ignavibacteriaceae bacterium]|nr:choice-of-anchor D domain-containing protein [Ignavibacteriaceae bacterium]